MKICVLDNEKTNLCELLPEWLHKASKSENEIVIGAVEDNRLLCFAMFKKAPVWTDVVSMDFLYTATEARERGIAKELLVFAENYFRNYGNRSIYMKTIGNFEFLKRTFRFLTSENFCPIVLEGHLMEYSVSTLKNSNLSKNLKTLEPIMKNVSNLTDKSDDYLKEIIYYKGLDEHAEIEHVEYDKSRSFFYEDNGNIRGSLFTQVSDDGNLHVVAGYVENNIDCKIIFPALIASLLKNILEDIDDERKVIFQVFSEAEYKGMLAQMGEPESYYIIQEYVKHLLTLDEDISLEGEKVLKYSEIKNRAEKYYDEKLIISEGDLPKDYYKQYLPTGTIYGGFLENSSFRIMSEYGIGRTDLLAKFYADGKIPKEFEGMAKQYKNEVTKFFDQMGLKPPKGDNNFNFYKSVPSFEEYSLKDLNSFINKKDVMWKPAKVHFYYLQQLNDTYYSELINKYKGELPKVISGQSKYSNTVIDFDNLAMDKDLDFDIEYYNEELSNFYLEDGKIKAALWAEQLTERIYIVHELFVDQGLKEKKAILALLFNLLNVLAYRHGDDTKIGFEESSERSSGNLYTYMGKGYRDLEVHERRNFEGIRYMEVEDITGKKYKELHMSDLQDKDMEDILPLLKEYDDEAIYEFHALVLQPNYQNAFKYFDCHRGVRYATVDKNRKILAKKIIELTKGSC